MEETRVVVDSETQVTPIEVQQEQPKTYTQEELNKAIQSASSKAKFEVLTSLGINNVDEFKNLRNDYEQVKKSDEEVKGKYNALQSEFESYKKESFAKGLGIAEEQFKDFNVLVNSKVDAEHSYEEVAKQVASQYFTKVDAPITAVQTSNQLEPTPTYKTFGW